MSYIHETKKSSQSLMTAMSGHIYELLEKKRLKMHQKWCMISMMFWLFNDVHDKLKHLMMGLLWLGTLKDKER